MPKLSTNEQPAIKEDDEELPRDDYEGKDTDLDDQFKDEDDDDKVEAGEETEEEVNAEIDISDDF